MPSRLRSAALSLPAVAGIVAALVLLLGCGRSEPIRVAFAGPTSGSSAEDGLSAVRGIELVFERVNAEGGVGGRPLELEVYDDANDPERARTVALAIADASDAVAVIGHNTSTCSIAAGEVYAARELPALATAATSVAVTHDNPWYFRTIYNDRAQGRLVTAYVRGVLGAERFAIVHETGAYGAFLAEVMGETAPEVGLRHASWTFDPGDPALAERLEAIAVEATRDGSPVLVLAMQPDEGILLVKRLRDRGFAGKLLVTDALASQAFAGGFGHLPEERAQPGFYTDGIYASTPFLFDTAGRRAAEFMREYSARYEHPPDWYAAFAADAAGVLVEALRRGEVSPSSGTLAADRSALRRELAAIRSFRPVEGVTGPTWFDAVGDAQKPVPMGIFLNGEIVSAFAQLGLAPGRASADAPGALDPARIFQLGERRLYRTDVARVGARARRFGKLDFDAGVFELEFDLWFRHHGDREVEDIVFANAVEPVELGEPLEELVVGSVHYRRYGARGLFRTDTIAPPYGGHIVALSFRHRERPRSDLILAVDRVGMSLGRSSDRQQRGAPARRLLSAMSDWTVSDFLFFEEEVDEPALGHPGYLRGAAPVRPVSQLTVGILLKSQALSLRGTVPPGLRIPLCVIAALGSVLLLFVGRGSRSAPRFALQVVLAYTLLVASEPLVGGWLQQRVAPTQLAQLVRVLDILWWLLPAVLLNVALHRFVWRRAEELSGNPVPSLLRYTVAAVILLLAVFGIIAFVYDYRLTGLLATSGVVAMIIGLAVQLNITNIFAGVALNLERSFRVGDWIMIHGRTPDPESSIIGMVTDINWRTTRVQTADDTEIVIPNGVISEKTITNFMHPGEMSRFELVFTVDQSVAPDRVIAVMREALDEILGAEHDGPLADPGPSVRIGRVTEMGVEYLIRYRIVPREVSPARARHSINESVLRHLHEAGIRLAYPRRVMVQRNENAGSEADR